MESRLTPTPYDPPPMTAADLRTGEEWCALLYPDTVIYDADGWRNQGWDPQTTRLTREEFEAAFMVSTIAPKPRPTPPPPAADAPRRLTYRERVEALESELRGAEPGTMYAEPDYRTGYRHALGDSAAIAAEADAELAAVRADRDRLALEVAALRGAMPDPDQLVSILSDDEDGPTRAFARLERLEATIRAALGVTSQEATDAD